MKQPVVLKIAVQAQKIVCRGSIFAVNGRQKIALRPSFGFSFSKTFHLETKTSDSCSVLELIFPKFFLPLTHPESLYRPGDNDR
ncbi:hypothetical protein [Rahnella selenatireducens]|uniref:hypothetical protein n=1 Tax=Rahnella selenatireducens TaxID=3389797 RepID=UPI0039689032